MMQAGDAKIGLTPMAAYVFEFAGLICVHLCVLDATADDCGLNMFQEILASQRL